MNKITEKMKNPADCGLLSVLVFYHILLLADKKHINCFISEEGFVQEEIILYYFF